MNPLQRSKGTLSPDYVAPLRAYRAWYWNDGQVTSLNGTIWEPREAHVAKCALSFDLADYWAQGDKVVWDDELETWVSLLHVAPEKDCTCGVYAGKNFEHLVEINYANYGIHGEVDLWGKVQECTLGYRAQYAYPRFFVVPPSMLIGNMWDVEFRLKTLERFEIDIYIAESSEAHENMGRILLKRPNEEYTQEGANFLASVIQKSYDAMAGYSRKVPQVGDRVFIKGKGISVITVVTDARIEATLFNRVVCTMLKKDIRWNPIYGHFFWDEGSFSIRGR